MSLKQTYTWNDFKKETGEKAKGLKRTSAEGIKAFETAQKAYFKEVLKARREKAKRDMEKAKNQIETYRNALKGLKSLKRRQSLSKKIRNKQHRIANCTQTLVKEEARSL